jgi:hypothetical protein
MPDQTRTSETESPSQPAGLIFGSGVVLLAGAVLVIYLLTAMWPCARPAGDTEITLFHSWTFTVNYEVQLLWIVVLAAVLGSFVHVATSFASFVGNRTFSRSWMWWYILRPPIGVALGLILYFVVRGGLFSSDANAASLNPYGIAALAGLAGMFSKQATDKLRELFDNFFRTKSGGDATRADKLAEEITSTRTTQATVGDQTITTTDTHVSDTDAGPTDRE